MTVTRQPNKLKAHVIKGSLGLFISPQGEVVQVQQFHIHSIILDPAKFGLTVYEIESAYAQHNEPLGVEGKAREEILRGLIVKGWIQLRRYIRPREQWSIAENELSDETRAWLREWAVMILTGALGYREDDPYKPVLVTELASGKVARYTAEALASGDF